MKNLLTYLIILIVTAGCGDNSALDVELDNLTTDNCNCWETYYEATIECYNLEFEGLKLREKDCYIYLEGITPTESAKHFDSIVKPAYKKRDSIVWKCADLGYLDDFDKCWKELESLKNEEYDLFDELVEERNRVADLPKRLNIN